MEAYLISCLQEFQFNLINHLKAQVSELETAIKTILLGLNTKLETRNKQTVFTEFSGQLLSSERDEETTVPEKEMGDKTIDCFEFIK